MKKLIEVAIGERESLPILDYNFYRFLEPHPEWCAMDRRMGNLLPMLFNFNVGCAPQIQPTPGMVSPDLTGFISISDSVGYQLDWEN
jgi:hypothetical protein